MEHLFRKFASKTSAIAGSPISFILAIVVIVMWAITGRMFNYSDTWQLVINTSTTIITFLMVFLIQNTQNRDSRAMQLKLDELIRGVKGARSSLINVEELSDLELDELQNEFRLMQEKYQQALEKKRLKKEQNATK